MNPAVTDALRREGLISLDGSGELTSKGEQWFSALAAASDSAPLEFPISGPELITSTFALDR
ncbi:MAG: hypothetical protein QOH26_755 [Actinomycetota bacterium]|nr:hypothetical protein [Actinomycetota bacterium]